MSVSVESLFTPNELTLELEWLEARDMLLGENFVGQDLRRALELAAASEHPQCQWLTSLFAGKTVSTVKEACDVFLEEEKKSPASLCFVALLNWPLDEDLLRECAAMGSTLAQAKMAGMTNEEEIFRFAKSAASQRERDGFFCLGRYHWHSDGCEKDLEKAKEFFLVAAQLGAGFGGDELRCSGFLTRSFAICMSKFKSSHPVLGMAMSCFRLEKR
jgi:hypothetical protein